MKARNRKAQYISALIIYTVIIFSAVGLSNSASAQISFDASGPNGGAILLGESTSSCTASLEGGIRYNSSSSQLEFCDGLNWTSLIAASCPNDLPNNWSFTPLASQATSTLVTSSIHQLANITGCTVQVKVSGDGSPEYQICADSSCSTVKQSWTSTEGSAINGDYVQMRLTTNSAGNVTSNATLIVGARSEGWSVSTQGDCSDPSPPAGTLCADGTMYVGTTPDGGTKMYTTPCNEGRTWDGTGCSGSHLELRWSEGATVNVAGLSNIQGENNTAILAPLSNADSPYPAAIRCDTLVYGGQSDWYLPARDEAQLLQGACNILPEITCGSAQDHWSSTQNNAAEATEWESRGVIEPETKTQIGNQRIRCVRKDWFLILTILVASKRIVFCSAQKDNSVNESLN